jgi:endonuclease G
MCHFSAVNIDGSKAGKVARGPWRWDARIPRSQQIMKECYGNPPKFSRGHMTRREDPVWGGKEDAVLGNADSMHVTNTVPQMQSFNAPIWLGLEDYALGHARKDGMRICVFTGPFFDDARDPVLYGVRVPRSFWKVIAFVHDDTGKLCATGYRMSQEEELPAREFVYGEYTAGNGETTQVSLAEIERDAGLSFGKLTGLDPKRRAPELPGPPAPLRTFAEIVFV